MWLVLWRLWKGDLGLVQFLCWVLVRVFECILGRWGRVCGVLSFPKPGVRGRLHVWLN